MSKRIPRKLETRVRVNKIAERMMYTVMLIYSGIAVLIGTKYFPDNSLYFGFLVIAAPIFVVILITWKFEAWVKFINRYYISHFEIEEPDRA